MLRIETDGHTYGQTEWFIETALFIHIDKLLLVSLYHLHLPRQELGDVLQYLRLIQEVSRMPEKITFQYDYRGKTENRVFS